MVRRPTLLCFWLVAAIAVASPVPAHAGWISITNDTQHVMVVQESFSMLPPIRRPKAVKLLPGEAYREFQSCGTEKKVQVFDARCPTRPVLQGTLTWRADDVTLKLEPDVAGVTLTGPPAVNGQGPSVVLKPLPGPTILPTPMTPR